MERPPGPPSRRLANDWLTVLGMGAVFLFHCARFFDAEDWHVKNPAPSPGLTIFVQCVGLWAMPLFFLLSGMSIRYSLRRRSPAAYLADRARRLLPPLAFSTLVLAIPFQVWAERVSHGQFAGSFWAFYPHYFDGLYAFGGNFAWMGLHLWYLEILFLFSALGLPLFLLLQRAAPTDRPPLAARGWAGLGWAVPVILVELAVNLQPEGIGMRAFGGWSPLTYLAVLFIGFRLAGDARQAAALERTRLPALALALAATAGLFLLPDPGYVARAVLRGAACWFWLATFLGLAGAYLEFAPAWLARARDAVLPFYVLHQTVIVGVGLGLRDWDLAVPVKYLLLAALSLAGTLALYAGIARVRILRPLFGMRGA